MTCYNKLIHHITYIIASTCKGDIFLEKFSLELNTDIPLYHQISQIILNQIEQGIFKPGTKLPSESELIECFGVSRITIRSALAELIDEGVINSIKGKGSFVASPKALYTADDHYGFTRSCQIAGKTASTKVLDINLVYPPQSIASFLNVDVSDKVIMIQRLRYVNQTPMLLETNHYPMSYSFLLNENLNGSLFDLLGTKYDITIGKSVRTLEACMPTDVEAKVLGISKNTPLLLFKDQHMAKDGSPLFTSKQVYCSEKMKFYL